MYPLFDCIVTETIVAEEYGTRYIGIERYTTCFLTIITEQHHAYPQE